MRSKFKWIFALLLAFSMQFSFAQEKTVTGKITEAGMPMPGVSVTIKGTQTGTQSDFDGMYSIKVNQGQTLVFSFIGMKEVSMVVGASNSINVEMKLDAEVLKDVVVTNYVTQKKARTASAVTSVNIEELEERAQASVIQNLQGMVAGLNIATGSGQPGSDSTILIRGVGSLNGNIEPLIIVDGMPVDEDGFRSISQADIVSTSVLKDAAATSIYGNRGANGVLIITTRRGKFNQDLEVRYQGQYGITKLQEFKINTMNSSQVLNLQKEYNEGPGASMSDEEFANASKINTNWRDVFFRTGTTQQHDISFSSGSKNTRNFTSIGFLDQEGIFITSNFKRFNFRNNFSGKTNNEKFSYSAGLNVNYSKSNNVSGAGSNAVFFAPFSAAIKAYPFLDSATELPYGDISALSVDNAPLVLLNSMKMNSNMNEELKILANFTADYKITDNITAGINLGVDYSGYDSKSTTHPKSLLGPHQVDSDAVFGGIHSESTSRDFRFNSNTYLKYSNVFNDKHSVDAGVYVEYYKAHYNGFGFQKRGLDERIVGTSSGFISPVVESNVSSFPLYIPTVNSFKVQEGLFSYFGSVDYDYNDQFGISGTIRRDASFRFVNENKWGTFWSLGGRWNIINANNVTPESFINDLKLRASYGTSGNQRVDNAQYTALTLPYTLYGIGSGYNGISSTALAQIKNPEVRWEEISQLNVGLDFVFWKDKMSGSLDVYRKLTEQLYQTVPVSPIHGTWGMDTNVGSLENKGIELSLDYNVYNNKDWNFKVGGNVSYNKNKILALPGSTGGLIFGGGSTALAEGQPVGAYYVSQYAGVNPANGNPLFHTADGGLTELIKDADRQFSGRNIYPIWQGGFTTNIAYKGFGLYTQWSFVADLYRNNLDLATLEDGNSLDQGSNKTTSLLDAWKTPGDITSIPRIGHGYNEIDYINGTDRYLHDASYLRLRNINLSYTFDKDVLEKTFINSMKFYIQAENIVTFSKWQGWDPEAGFRGTDRGNYPTPKIFTIGSVITF